MPAAAGERRPGTSMNAFCNPILEPSAYSHVFGRWAGARVRIFSPPGNTGDLLIREGTLQLLQHFGIAITEGGQNGDTVFWAGGGNMGSLNKTKGQVTYQLDDASGDEHLRPRQRSHLCRIFCGHSSRDPEFLRAERLVRFRAFEGDYPLIGRQLRADQNRFLGTKSAHAFFGRWKFKNCNRRRRHHGKSRRHRQCKQEGREFHCTEAGRSGRIGMRSVEMTDERLRKFHERELGDGGSGNSALGSRVAG